MKRVLLVTSFFRPEPGGPEGLFTGLARSWDPKQLHVLVTAAPEAYLRDATSRYRFDQGQPFTIERFAPRTDVMGSDVVFEQRARELIERLAPEHILFGDIGPVSRLVLRAVQRSVPYSVFLNGADLKNNLGFFKFRARRFVLNARNVFVLSQFMARSTQGFGIAEERISVIPPGIEPSAKPARAGQLPAQWLRSSKGKTVFVAAGPFLPRKGLDLIVEAVYLLSAAVRNRIHVFLLGSGPDFTYVQELIRIRGLESSLTMSGFVSDAWYHSMLKRSDVFLQPGREREDDSAGLGTALMEAAHHGLPCIAGSLAGVPERVRDGVSGYLIEPGNPTALAKKMTDMVEHPKAISRLGRNAREIATRDYDFARTLAAVVGRI